MKKGSGRYWNRRVGGGGGRSWHGRSSNDALTTQNVSGEGISMHQNSGRSAHRRNYSNSISRGNPRRYGPPMDDFDRIEEIGIRTSNSISIAIEGCCHGQLSAIYDRLRKYEEDDDSGKVEGTVPCQRDTTENSLTGVDLKHHKTSSKKIDLLICCGDFQSIRTPADFHSLAVPAKYREMGTFHKYYNGEWVAPVLTIFCGGNHEASQPLSELYYGGWVAPKMYYLGAAGVVRFRGIRIGGLSGIYKSHDHYQSRNEIPPYDEKQLRSVYHYRNLDVYRLSCLRAGPPILRQIDNGNTLTTNDSPSQQLNDLQPSRRLDIMVSHDWPHGIEQYGDVKDLVRRKPFFRQEISENAFGSPPAAHLLHTLQPLYWFAAHLHVKFHARVIHRNNIGSAESAGWQLSADVAEGKGLIPSQVLNARIRSSSDNAKDSLEALTKELKDPSLVSVLDEMKDGTTALPSAAAAPLTTQFLSPESLPCPNTMPDLTEQMTQFLSLDKCLPRKKYLAILHVPVHYPSDSDACNDSKLEYDLEWLAILRKTHHLAASSHPHRVQLPQMIRSNGRTIYPHQVTDADIAWVKERIGEDLTIPENFVPTLPEKYDEQNPPAAQPPPLPRMGNPQTDTLLELLQLEHLPNLTIPYCREQGQQASFSSTPSQEPVRSQNLSFADRDEIDLDEDIESSFNTEIVYSKDVDRDEDEIDVDDEVSSNVLQIDESLVQNDMKKPRLDEGR